MTGLETAGSIIAIMTRMLDGLEVHEDRLREGMRSEIYATDKVFEIVSAGGSFRDSYKTVGLDLESVSSLDADAAIRRRTSTGTRGNLALKEDMTALEELSGRVECELDRLGKVYLGLCGRQLEVCTL